MADRFEIWLKPSRVHDHDFIDWWDGYDNPRMARMLFAGYVRLGMADTKARYEPRADGGSGGKRRSGRRKEADPVIRIKLSRAQFSDLDTLWASFPRKSKTLLFVALWRNGFNSGKNPLHAIVQDRVKAAIMERDVDEEVIGPPISADSRNNESFRKTWQSLEVFGQGDEEESDSTSLADASAQLYKQAGQG